MSMKQTPQSVGEGSGLVFQFIKAFSIIVAGFAVLAVLSFNVSWIKLTSNTPPPVEPKENVSPSIDLVEKTVEEPRATGTSSLLNEPGFQKWKKDVAGLQPEKQVEAVSKKLKELNPEFDEKVTHKIE